MNYSYVNDYGKTYTFEIVNKIPKGYDIWHIPMSYMGEKLIPLCKCYGGTFDVMTDCLKVLYVEDDDIYNLIVKAKGYGWSYDSDLVRRAKVEFDKFYEE